MMAVAALPRDNIEFRPGAFEIAVDGEGVAAIEHAETAEAAIDHGRHVLSIRSGRCSSHDRAFDVADREAVVFPLSRGHGLATVGRVLRQA
jgi:hypothetical protein